VTNSASSENNDDVPVKKVKTGGLEKIEEETD
jgi:hypothetical protein